MPKQHLMSTSTKEENYEHVLMCLICRNLFDDTDHQPKFLPCHHTFCKDCLRKYVQQMGDEIECPLCREPANVPAAGVAALQTNFYVKYIQSLVRGPAGWTGAVRECKRHPADQLQFYCQTCHVATCQQCCGGDTPEARNCRQHPKVALTTLTEESHQKLDSAFSRAHSTVESKKARVESLLKALSDEKDSALRKIDSSFEQHVHNLNRRSTLLKNKVIDIYKENVERLDNDLEEISTAMTCIVSLKDYHEDKISHGDFREITKGIEDIEEVNHNIGDRIRPSENHIVYEDTHGTDKFRTAVKDLGRVRCTRPMAPRTEPEGFESGSGSLGSRALHPQGSMDEVTTPAEDQHGEGASSPAQPSTSLMHTPSPEHNGSSQHLDDEDHFSAAISREIYMNGNDNDACDMPLNDLNKSSPSTLGGCEGAGPSTSYNQPSSSGASTAMSRSLPPTGHENTASKGSKGLKGCKGKNLPREGLEPRDQGPGPRKAQKPPGKPNPPSHLSLTSMCVDPNANTSHEAPPPLNLNRFGANGNLGPVGNLRVEKDYYHMVYTSYDEEELLRELKASKAAAAARSAEDDVSFKTLSSGDDSAPVSAEELPSAEHEPSS